MDFIKEKINTISEKLKELSEERYSYISAEYVLCDGYKTSNEFPNNDAGWQKLPNDYRFSGVDKHFWVRFNIEPVKVPDNKELVLSVKTGREGQWDGCNPQGLVFLNGKSTQALDINHTWLALDGNKEYEVYIYFYTGMEGGFFEFIPTLIFRDKPTYDLYWDIKVPFDSMLQLGEGSYDYIKIRDALDKALLRLDIRDFYSENYYNSISETKEFLKNELYTNPAGGNGAEISCIGHTHIDVAWLWTVAQTREKAERSFSTVVNLMKRYPEYKFMSSQPQLYQHVKEANPGLFEEIKKLVKEGRWEVEGAMWLEADCNLISGESMVRQILHGKKFMKDEFGVESNILWLPDVFGYSAALPQILKKSNVNRFFTSKIAWNETNVMPHDTFIWEGLDGTEIFTSFIESYVTNTSPANVLGAWKKYKDKSITNHVLATVGFGDGGGGTTPEMMEMHERLKNGLPGMPKTTFRKAGEFFDIIEKDFDKNTKELRFVPKWNGELYLEMHRGTYTSIAKNKKNNRKSELLYQEAETLNVSDMLLCGGEYQKDVLDKNQINILLNQFHDIIPGSSIKEVYDVTDVEYERILGEGRELADNCKKNIVNNISTDGGIFVYNPTPYELSDYVCAGENVYYAENIPAHGYKVIAENPVDFGVTVTDKAIENDVIKVTFDDNYEIISIFDKEENREVISKGESANRLEVYEDYPRCFDAWEITSYYKQKMWKCDNVADVKNTDRGILITRKYGKSTVEQEIVLRGGSKRIDFITKIDWHEDHVLLKTVFPVDIHSKRATYDIQFGNVERPTTRNNSWEAAKFEVCGHKWADISEGNYGVSLLNDCKYGYSIEENIMTLSLLKAATYPNPAADRGTHEFTYSLLPHEGDFRGETIKEAYALNIPLEAEKVEKNSGKLADTFSPVSCDKENICVETIKKAENDDSIIVRLFDNYNMKSNATLKFGFDIKKAYICNLLEDNIEEIDFDGREITVPVSNYEIVTLKLIV